MQCSHYRRRNAGKYSCHKRENAQSLQERECRQAQWVMSEEMPASNVTREDCPSCQYAVPNCSLARASCLSVLCDPGKLADTIAFFSHSRASFKAQAKVNALSSLSLSSTSTSGGSAGSSIDCNLMVGWMLYRECQVRCCHAVVLLAGDCWLAVLHEHMVLCGICVITSQEHNLCKACLHGYL